jgi:hypothetical protein
VKTGVLPLVGWGAALLAIAALGAVVFGLNVLPAGLLAGAGAAAIAVGLVAAVAGGPRRAAAGDGTELLLVGSAATTVAAVGATIAVVGWAAGGPAFTWPGVGLCVLGLAGVVRERRAERRLLREGERG